MSLDGANQMFLLLYLFEKGYVVGVVVICEIEDTGGRVRSDPLQPSVPVRDAAWLRAFFLLILLGHGCCE